MFSFIYDFCYTGSSLLCTGRCSLVVASGGYTLLAENRLLIAVTSLVEHGSSRMDSVAVEHGLSCPAACRIFLDQGSNPCPLHWQAILNTGPPGKSRTFLISASSQLPSAQNNAILKWHSLRWHILLPLNTQHYKTMGKWKVKKVP